MLLIKTKLKPSSIEGIGLFANENINKGQVVWKGNGHLSFVTFNEIEWENLKNKLSLESFKQIKKYTYKDKRDGKYYHCLDDTRFINHSEMPNIAESQAGDDVAIKKIAKGDEIVIDYRSFFDTEYLKQEQRNWD